MARYHFNLYDGHNLLDDEGLQLASLSEARTQGVKFVGHALSDAGEAVFRDQEWRLEVTDERGLILFAVYVSAHDATAVRQPAPSDKTLRRVERSSLTGPRFFDGRTATVRR